MSNPLNRREEEAECTQLPLLSYGSSWYTGLDPHHVHVSLVWILIERYPYHLPIQTRILNSFNMNC